MENRFFPHFSFLKLNFEHIAMFIVIFFFVFPFQFFLEIYILRFNKVF